MNRNVEILLVVLLGVAVKQSNCLRCYTCSVTQDDSDTRCADDVISLGKDAITDCDKKYCTITRIDYLDPRGKLSSLNRNCVDKVPADGVTEDSTFRTYQRSCKSDLCNAGSGKSETNEGVGYLGDKSTLIVPGTNKSSGNAIYSSIMSLLLTLFLIVRI